MSDDCIFCRIASGKVRAHVVHESDKLIAFLDLNPIRPGHTQIVPKAHIQYFDQAPAEIVTSIVLLGQTLASSMKQLYQVPRVGFLFTGGDIAHMHAHVVPLHEKTDITSRHYIAEARLTFREAPRMSDERLAATATELRHALGLAD